jgi:hypothetical protein
VHSIQPRTAAFALAALLALAAGTDLLWMPVQSSDTLGEMLDARQSPSAWSSFTEKFGGSGYLRPMRIAQIKALFDLADGRHYWLIYRGFHALLLGATLLLFVAVLRVSSATDFASAAFALSVFIGLHTFRPAVQEAFPVNHVLEMIACALLTLQLARSRNRWWVDALAAMTFVFAALTIESGLLVWVVAATAWTLGWRGISTRGVALMTLLGAGYFLLRFVYLDTGTPGLDERSSGFGFARLDPEELQARFGAQPLWFYAYNVAASALSVLFSEPRAGVFVATRAWTIGDVPPRIVLAVVTSAATTVLFAWTAIEQARRRIHDDTLRLLLLFAVVVAANAVLSFPYTKDDIIGVAGALYAVAAFAVMRHMLHRLPAMSRTASIALVVGLAALSVGWSVRAAGVHYMLRSQAFRQQNDWARLPGEWRRAGRWPTDPEARQLILQLRRDAIGLRLPNTEIGIPRWPDRLWEP